MHINLPILSYLTIILLNNHQMGIKTLIFGTAICTTIFITLTLIVFHFTIAGIIEWDDDLCKGDGYFSSCVQLDSYFMAMFLTIIVETIMFVLSISALFFTLIYLCCRKSNYTDYTPLETHAEQQLGSVQHPSHHDSMNPSPTYQASSPTPNEHHYSVNGGSKYHTMI